MQNKAKTIIIIILSVLLVISVIFNAIFIYYAYRANHGDEYIAGSELLEGDVAPDFSVKLLTGDTFTLSDNKGKVVFLNFWASWCSPCVAEMPAIQELSEQYEGNVVFIGIDIAENSKKVQDFIAKNGFTYNIGLDENGDISKNLYPSNGIPYTLIIDADGIITKIFLGGGDQMHEVFEGAITEALNQ